MSGSRYKWLGFTTEARENVLIKYDDIIEIEDTSYDFVRLHLSNGEILNVLGSFNEVYQSIIKGSGSWY